MDAYERSDLPAGMKQGLLAARNHYDEVDLEPFKLNLMQALDIAEGRIAAATTPPPMMRLPEGEEVDAASQGDGELRGFILHVVQHFDQGDGVDFNTILKNAAARGYVREQAEAMLDELSDSGEIAEPRFGWFRALAPTEE